MTSAAYETAIKIHDRACHVYQAAVSQYRDLVTDDDTFLAARAIKDQADAAFDVAFLAEQNRPEEEEQEDDAQLTLL